VTVSSATEPWQGRLDQLSRLVPLPLLAVSTVMAALLAKSGYGSPRRFELALALAVLAALWTAAFTARPARGPVRDVVAFVGHTALAAVLVGLNPFFGFFAFTGYLLADRLPRPASRLGLLATATVITASQLAGYPRLELGSIIGYVIVTSVNASLALAFSGITDRVLEQNRERGVAIAELGEANRKLELALAENAGLHAQLLAQAREAGILDERQRLAGEIHDTLAQGLIGIITQLEAAEQARERPSEWGRHLGQARELARSSLAAARRSMRALRPEQLERATLVDALEELARSWTRSSGVAVQTETTGCPHPAPRDVEAALFRVAQEALANVGKHAGASVVGLTLSYLDGVLLLDVRDDGTGFDPDAGSAGFGLTGMRDRLARIGGRLELETAPGEGTALNAAVPIAGDGGQR
jgi:signal transduction histidine kinase